MCWLPFLCSVSPQLLSPSGEGVSSCVHRTCHWSDVVGMTDKQGYRTIHPNLEEPANQRPPWIPEHRQTVSCSAPHLPGSCNSDMLCWEEDPFPVQQRGGGQRNPCWPPDLNSLSPPVLKVLAASPAVTVLLAGGPAGRIVGYLQC